RRGPPTRTATSTPSKTLANSSSRWCSEKRGAERQLGAAPHKTNRRLLGRFREKGQVGLGVHFEDFHSGFGELRSLAVVDAAAGELHTWRGSTHVHEVAPDLQNFGRTLRRDLAIPGADQQVRFRIKVELCFGGAR